MQETGVPAWRGILWQLCPRCRKGKIFRRSMFLLPPMFERCPICSLKFEREDGYFLGAMYIGYGLGCGVIAAFAALFWWIFRWDVVNSTIAGVIAFLPFAPLLTVLARVMWIYMDQAIDPDQS